MGRVRVVCFLVHNSEDGSPRLCRLRTNSLSLMNKIDYVRTHLRLWGPAILVALTIAELDDTLPHFMDVQWDSVWATHECPSKLSRGRQH
jgi:hypothetical protein